MTAKEEIHKRDKEKEALVNVCEKNKEAAMVLTKEKEKLMKELKV